MLLRIHTVASTVFGLHPERGGGGEFGRGPREKKKKRREGERKKKAVLLISHIYVAGTCA